MLKQVIRIACCAALFAGCPAIHAQEFPSKTIRIVASEAGGGPDLVVRILAQQIAPALGQQIVIDNRSGGTIAGDFVARSAPDGYTLLYYGNTLWLLQLMRSNMPYDPLRDFAPISWTLSTPNVLIVHPALPVKSVRDLIALAKARPGELNFSSAAAGTSNHLAGELFKSMTNTNILRVPYKGVASAMNALMSGEVQVMFPTAGSISQHLASGRLRALAVTTAQPSPIFPNLPTLAAAGVPGYEFVAAFGLLAPAKTPAPIINRLNREFVTALQRPDIKERLAKNGDNVIASTPEAFAKKMQDDVAVLGKVIKDAGIRDE